MFVYSPGMAWKPMQRLATECGSPPPIPPLCLACPSSLRKKHTPAHRREEEQLNMEERDVAIPDDHLDAGIGFTSNR